MDSMSNRQAKEAGANVVGSIASFIYKKSSVENLVENEAELRLRRPAKTVGP